MVNTNNNWLAMTDSAIVKVIGNYIKNQRLLQNKSQEKLAEAAGLNRWTLSQIENGEAITMLSLIQILRALGLLHILEIFKVEQQVSPIALAKLAKQKRQRASKKDNEEQPETDW